MTNDNSNTSTSKILARMGLKNSSGHDSTAQKATPDAPNDTPKNQPGPTMANVLAQCLENPKNKQRIPNS